MISDLLFCRSEVETADEHGRVLTLWGRGGRAAHEKVWNGLEKDEDVKAEKGRFMRLRPMGPMCDPPAFVPASVRALEKQHPCCVMQLRYKSQLSRQVPSTDNYEP